MQIRIPSHLSDQELVVELKRVAGCEREATAQLVAHLAELDTRGLHLAAGYSSLFAYCCEELRLSEDATCNRIAAARAARRFPQILDLLGGGSVSVTTARLLGKHLTPENHLELLAAASGRSRREVEELLAQRFPQADTPFSLRKVPAPRETAVSTPPLIPPPSDVLLDLSGPAQVAEAVAPSVAGRTVPSAVPAPLRPARVTPLSTDRYELKVTLSSQTRDKLRQAQDLLRHAVPSGDTSEILDRALTLLLAAVARGKFAMTDRPRESRKVASSSRHISAEVRRAVGLRDGQRCAFVSRGGRRCSARGPLEFHHVKPYAAGGGPTVDNIELRCAAHNRYESGLFFAGMVREPEVVYGLGAGNPIRPGTDERSPPR
jgi:hypothetical protein